MDFNGDCEEAMIVRPHDKDNEDDWDDWGEIDRPPHIRRRLMVYEALKKEYVDINKV